MYRIRYVLIMLFALALAGAPGTALAAEAAKIDSGNTAWLLTSTALVLFMTLPGLSLFYGGLVRGRNVLSVLMQCFAIACIVSILWMAYLYSLIFTGGGGAQAIIGGLGKSFMAGVTVDSVNGSIPETVFSTFQLTFAIITPALIVGAITERMRFSALVWFCIIWVTLVYAPVAHWVWGGGWLQKMGAIDFAGGTVVHITAGVSALVAALMIGPRRGFPDTAMLPHNLPMAVMGAGMLWVGWFGFNAGSALAADGAAGMAMLVTHLSAAAGALAWMFAEWVKYGKASVLGIVTGTVAGLVAITPAAGSAGPAGAVVLGAIAGLACMVATTYMKRTLKVDDSLDVFTVHGVGGIVGSVLTGILVSGDLGILSGIGLAKGMTIGGQLWIQIIGVAVVAVYAAIVSFIILKVLDAAIGLRVEPEEEQSGLDLSQHNESGYEF